MPKVVVINHPLLKELLTILRDKRTNYPLFRQVLKEVGRFIAYEILRNYDVEEIRIETPLSSAIGFRVKDLENTVIVCILRAAMPFVEGMVEVMNRAKIAFVAAQRVEEEVIHDFVFKIKTPYIKLPNDMSKFIVIIADPMFATGCTILRVLNEVYRRGRPLRTIIATVISTKLAISRVTSKYQEVEVYTLSIDPILNNKGYIVPGLGDAGARALGLD